MSTFERYLTVWVALCIVAGIALGHFFPSFFQAIGSAEIAQVNLPVAVLIWLMIIPMLVKIDFAALGQVKEHWRGIGVTLFINWGVKPFSMALLGCLFIGWLFKPYLPADQINSYIAGLILLAAAPCTAMVFVWSNLSHGEPHFTREVRLDLDPWLESTRALGPLIDPNEHACGSVPPHGHRELAHFEPGFYTVGIKSYGRAPTFLLLTGYEQVRSVAAALAGDVAAAG
jgi:hypothetical protein